MRYDDALGDALKAAEAVETERRAMPGECVMVRVDGIAFSNFTASMEKPYDRRMADTMLATATRLLEAHAPAFVYTQSDEITMVFGPGEEGKPLPYDGRLQKLASTMAGKATSYFTLEAVKNFPGDFDRLVKMAPAFDGRAVAVDRDLVAQFILWRELDARRNAALAAGRAVFGHSKLGGKTPADVKRMLAEAGVFIHEDYPSHFARGALLRRRDVELKLTEEELARIPEQVREMKRGQTFLRSRTVEVVDRGPFYATENLRGFLFDDETPVIVEKPFAASVTP